MTWGKLDHRTLVGVDRNEWERWGTGAVLGPETTITQQCKTAEDTGDCCPTSSKNFEAGEERSEYKCRHACVRVRMRVSAHTHTEGRERKRAELFGISSFKDTNPVMQTPPS